MALIDSCSEDLTMEGSAQEKVGVKTVHESAPLHVERRMRLWEEQWVLQKELEPAPADHSSRRAGHFPFMQVR